MNRPRQSNIKGFPAIKEIGFRLGLSIRLLEFVMKEIWRKIEGFPKYEISNIGRIKSFYRVQPRIICLTKDARSGHPMVCIKKNKKTHTFYVHKLVLIQFKGKKPTPKHECCHIDGNCENNHIDNLRWGTRKENIADRIKHGTFIRGERSNLSKLKEKEVIEIKKLIKNNFSFAIANEIGNKYKISATTIYDIKRGKSWVHVKI